jgi:hypothetical protein
MGAMDQAREGAQPPAFSLGWYRALAKGGRYRRAEASFLKPAGQLGGRFMLSFVHPHPTPRARCVEGN